MLNEDNAGYFRFTGPQRFDKAIHTLAGILKGITADGEVTPDELHVLADWIFQHQEFIQRHPFSEVIPVLSQALEDRVLTKEEQFDLLWLCDRLTADDRYYEAVTVNMQQLHGLLAGVSLDGTISEAELRGVREWLDEHEVLRTLWPYDEIDSVVTAVLADGKIDTDEHGELLAFFAEFTNAPRRVIPAVKADVSMTVRGVCATDPQIEFKDRKFCFTGKSKRATRRELIEEIRNRGGHHRDGVTKDLDYLIVGADGNPCWAYACYGRKIEEAVQHRKNGYRMLLVHEHDFWDAV